MSVAALRAALADELVAEHPIDAALALEPAAPGDAAAELAAREPARAARVLDRMTADQLGAVLAALPADALGHLMPRIATPATAAALAWLDEDTRQRVTAGLDPATSEQLSEFMAFPPDSAGALMDPRVIALRPGTTAAEARATLRHASRDVYQVYLVDADGRLLGAVPVSTLAVADADQRLDALSLERPPAADVLFTREDLVELMTRVGVPSIAVVDTDGTLVGVLRHRALVGAAADEAAADIQAMVGASKDEHALSPIGFAVRKRLPWLHINLLTAFLAAAVVGLFESTIAVVTSLAVLLPVVAGQSGNGGAQALAVTMRGLAVRQVRTSHWRRLAFKEFAVGLGNGIAIAITCGAGVYVWSGSAYLALVIMVSMVVSMAAAGLAGASIPIILKRLGQDPAQSSSIILTTITDVVGFSSFLGLATFMLEYL
jgi:magnesium transporter